MLFLQVILMLFLLFVRFGEQDACALKLANLNEIWEKNPKKIENPKIRNKDSRLTNLPLVSSNSLDPTFAMFV